MATHRVVSRRIKYKKQVDPFSLPTLISWLLEEGWKNCIRFLECFSRKQKIFFDLFFEKK